MAGSGSKRQSAGNKEQATPSKAGFRKRLKKLKPTTKTVDRNQKKLNRHLNKFLSSRFEHLRAVRRKVVIWLLLIAGLLSVGYAQILIYSDSTRTVVQAAGGTYAEGVIGEISTINPLYVATDAEKSASSLVYPGLFSHGYTGSLDPQLAVSYKAKDEGKVYEIKLRDNVRWSDGEKFTADDVVYTIDLIKNPKANANSQSSWQNIEVYKIDDLTVGFNIKRATAYFPFALTFGILPKHILSDIDASNVRSYVIDNPIKVVGTGPFVYRSTESAAPNQSILHFRANDRYFRGKVELNHMTIRTYNNSDDLFSGYKAKEINAAAGLSLHDAAESSAMKDSQLNQIDVSDGVFALFNNSGEFTSNKLVRQALRLATDREAVRQTAVPSGDENKIDLPAKLETPVPLGIFDDVDNQTQPEFNIEAAKAKLDEAGWTLNSSNIREKDGTEMLLNVVTVKGADYEPAAEALTKQWQKLGIKIELTKADASSIQQNYLITRGYDVLIYQLRLGADPDVSAYWSSSQATARGLNFANYKSAYSDLSLSNGRSELDNQKRSNLYKSFVQRWIEDVPAIALYQAKYYYLTNNEVESLHNGDSLIDPSSRFSDVSSWAVNKRSANVTP